jgi:transposase InsO family protein
MKQIDPIALFRLSVLGPLVSRGDLARGELQRLIRELAQREYDIPGSRRQRLGEKTIQNWYYTWRREGIAGLERKVRLDHGRSRMSDEIQAAILAAKRDNPRRSIRQIRVLLEAAGTLARGSVSRSAIHRLLKQHGLSRVGGSASEPEEHRRFNAQFAGSIWYGDVMHGPRLVLGGRMRKTYLASLLDDASRLVAHAAFGLAESALEIEGILKQALLRRGLPAMLVVDNGAAYRAASLQGICIRLGIKLVYCRPYAPEGKGKLERWHRTLRDQFLSELDASRIGDLHDLNARFWAWLEGVYHVAPHAGLHGDTPLARYQQDLPRIRTLGLLANGLDALFHHRVSRFVRKDATVSYRGRLFEVPYELAGKNVRLVVDPHGGAVLGVEDQDGKSLGAATLLDALANSHRKRHKPQDQDATPKHPPTGPNLVELAHQRYYGPKED